MGSYFTECEYKLLLAALSRERKVCEMVDKDCGEEHKLLRYMDSIEKKIKYIQHNNKPIEDVCRWKYDESEYYYETECGNIHLFFDGTPKDNGYVYCPYCGKKICVENYEKSK